MKIINLLLTGSIVFLTFIFGCSSSVNITDNSKMLNGKWLLTTLNSQEIVKEKAGKEMPYLEFDLIKNYVGGSTGCNDLSGKVVITGDDITFSDMSKTKMECPDAKYEDEFVGMIFHAETMKYKIDKSILSITKNEKVVMTFKKSE
jgi:heat shock protein HslJ